MESSIEYIVGEFSVLNISFKQYKSACAPTVIYGLQMFNPSCRVPTGVLLAAAARSQWRRTLDIQYICSLSNTIEQIDSASVVFRSAFLPRPQVAAALHGSTDARTR